MARRKYVKPDAPQISVQSEAPKLPIDADAGIKSIKRSGAIEYSPEVRKAEAAAWRKASAGQTRQEAEFSTAPGPNGKVIIRPTVVTDDNQMEGVGRVNAHVMPNDQIIFHTHSKYKDGKPSSTDIASAKSSGKPILTGSRDGLFETDPNTGKTEQLADGLDWTDPNKHLKSEDEQPPKMHNGGIVPGKPGEEKTVTLEAGERVIPRTETNADVAFFDVPKPVAPKRSAPEEARRAANRARDARTTLGRHLWNGKDVSR